MGDSVKITAVIVMMLASAAAAETNSIVADMASDSTPSPFIVSGSPYASAEVMPWKAFDSSKAIDGTYWDTYGGNPNGSWAEVDLGASQKVVHCYQLIASATYPTTNWTVYGSTNDSDWVSLDSRTADGAQWTTWGGTSSVFECSGNVTEYRYIKLVNSATSGGERIRIMNIAYYNVYTPPPPLPACAVLGSASSTGVSTLSGSDTGITVLQ
jgi:hypothetical protein